ncbi:TonB-dependent receptor [Sphingomonas parva]|uniref:TonB-dependent receptor n=2 Tax=Sphingomonas parva TaxID=2555898 RepID=A0A4Y8ZLC8_9SPHN|nr:TonB-dependent receptor [Sphingomonas parva]
MPLSRRLIVASLLAGAVQTPLLAQEATAPAATPQPPAEEPEPVALPAEGETQEIVVTGTRIRGQVDSDIPPEVQLDEQDVQSYGAASISELLDALEPLTRSARGRSGGRPVTLVNGRRISGFAEIRNLPPEAIERVDILPEEVALRYGYRADQRVVNFVLKPTYDAVTTELEGGLATAGGRATYGAEANVLHIDRAGRWNVEAEYQHQNPLLESERDIIATGGLLDERPFRSLIAESDQLSLGGTINRTILGDVSATLNGRVEANDSRSFIGLPPEGGETPLTRETESRTAHVGVALNGDVQPFRWAFTGNFDRGESESVIETGALPTVSNTVTQVANAELVASGPLFDLPAGEVSASVRVGAEHQGLRSETSRAGIDQARELSRGRGNVQASLDVPIASRRREVLSAIGDLSINLNAEAEQLSDFGTLTTLGAGLNWSPIEAVRVIASVTEEDGAPSMQQLGDPTVLVPNVRVFDFLRGTTVDVARLEGGNPDLLADSRRVFKLGVTAKPFGETDLTFRADYTNSRIRNPIASFPTATAEIEAAFPDRFVRDADGNLLSIDARPVNFARADRSELRWGFNYSLPLGDAPAGAGRGPGGGDGPPPGGRAGGGGGGRGFGGGMGRGGAGGAGRLQLGLFHTWHFTDEILIREGVPVLDLLNGSATGSSGGEPRHEIEAQAGISKDGLGARLSAQWRSGTTVRGVANNLGGTSGDLDFSDLTTVNLRLFANLDQQESLIRRAPWLSNTRVSLSINNLFDSRQRVTDSDRLTPVSYQPDYLDPLGRSVTLSLRKQF